MCRIRLTASLIFSVLWTTSSQSYCDRGLCWDPASHETRQKVEEAAKKQRVEEETKRRAEAEARRIAAEAEAKRAEEALRKEQRQKDTPNPPIPAGRWNVVSFTNSGGVTVGNLDARGGPFISIEAAGHVTAYDGCNPKYGWLNYESGKVRIAFSGISTLRLCPVNKTNSQLIGATGEANTWYVSGDTLIIGDAIKIILRKVGN